MSDEQKKSGFVGNCPEVVEHVFKPILNLKKELIDFAARNDLLAKDVAKCSAFLQKDTEDQFWRREVVKNVFAVFEASSFGIKKIAINQNNHWIIGFSAAEMAILNEEKYSLSDKGEALTQGNNFQRFIPNLKFAFIAFAKAHGFPYQWDSSADNPLKDFEKLRNRITHPKKLVDLSVADEEIKKVHELWNWFSRQFLQIIVNGQKNTLPPRMPPLPVLHLGVTKDFIVMLPNGDVHQFDSLMEATAFEKPFRVSNGSIELNPVLIRREELQ
jgi:hypothetical protein